VNELPTGEHDPYVVAGVGDLRGRLTGADHLAVHAIDAPADLFGELDDCDQALTVVGHNDLREALVVWKAGKLVRAADAPSSARRAGDVTQPTCCGMLLDMDNISVNEWWVMSASSAGWSSLEV
jgi:hypothetical protein